MFVLVESMYNPWPRELGPISLIYYMTASVLISLGIFWFNRQRKLESLNVTFKEEYTNIQSSYSALLHAV